MADCEDWKRNQVITVFSYPTENGLMCFEIKSPLGIGPRLCIDKVKELIEFLSQSIGSQEEINAKYKAERGISVPVETDPSRE